MDTNLQHEDLLIKLRSKLNQEKIKLWEAPYYQTDKTAVSKNLQDLADKYSAEFSTDSGIILEALLELQQHSIDRSKDNAEFQETGVATMRVKATVPGEKPNIFKVHKKLDVAGSELIESVATMLSTAESRVKLIFNGKVIKPNPTIGEQGVKNGTQIMALIMKETPEAVQQEESRYREMKTTRDDATLLSEVVDDIYDGDEEYMKLEDQSGKTVELPAAERKSLMVGLAMHERGRGALKQQDYPLALLLLLEADRLLSDCRSSILKTVDNWAVLQLDISWCYVCLRSLQHAADAATRLAAAEKAFRDTYGASQHRLLAVKGTAANERVLFMRLYLLQGIVAYHQNRRAEARTLLERAEVEMNALRVNSADVLTLVELGWSEAAARGGLRAAGGDVARAHNTLQAARDARREARAKHQQDRLTRALGVCVDGTPVSQQLVDGLIGMGFSRRRAIAALRNSNNHVADAVRLIQEQPDLLDDSDMSSDTDSMSDDSLPEADEKLTEELVAMGYELDQAKYALRLAKNQLNEAVDLLAEGGKLLQDDIDASTSGAGGSKKRRSERRERAKRRRDREAALQRLTTSIHTEADDHLDTSLTQEEDLLAKYKSLL